FVVWLLLFLVLVALAGLLDHRRRRGSQDLVDLVGLCIVFFVENDDVIIVVRQRVSFEVLDVVDVNVEVVLLDGVCILCVGGLSHHFFGLGLLLSRHCAAGA